MKGLSRTDLTNSEKVYLAAAAVATEGTYGAMSELSEQSGLTRPTLYALGRESRAALEQQFEASGPGALWVRVDQRQLQRAAIALRCTSPTSVPVITELLPILYPGLKVSYGSLHALLAESEQRAATFNAAVVLDGVEASALGEMFSQGRPVLSGIDLQSGFVSLLCLCQGRSAADWVEVLERAEKQGFTPRLFVKDAALGIAAAVSEKFPSAEQRDDSFHAAYELGKVHSRLERAAYGAIEREEHWVRELERAKKRRTSARESAQRLRWARDTAREAIELFDSFEQGQRRALEALEAVDVRLMRLRSPERMERELLACAHALLGLAHKGCRKVGRYLKNRTAGLVRYNAELHQALLSLGTGASLAQVRWGAVLWQAAELLYYGRQRWARDAQLSALREAWALLCSTLPQGRIAELLESIEGLFVRRFRASSAIEGLRAALRPHLYVHKSVSQGFLELFRAYVNLRPRRSGRHKGTSAYERLTGQPVQDWLSFLGYPPHSDHRQN